MNCPHCGSAKIYVIDKRNPPTSKAKGLQRYGAGMIRRRRKCYDCDERFTTYEGTKDQLREASI